MMLWMCYAELLHDFFCSSLLPKIRKIIFLISILSLLLYFYSNAARLEFSQSPLVTLVSDLPINQRSIF